MKRIRAKTHEEVLKPFLKDARFRKGYEEDLEKLQAEEQIKRGKVVSWADVKHRHRL